MAQDNKNLKKIKENFYSCGTSYKQKKNKGMAVLDNKK